MGLTSAIKPNKSTLNVTHKMFCHSISLNAL